MFILPPVIRASLSVLVIVAAAIACQAESSQPRGGKPAPLLLVSIDGFRHDYIERFDSPTLDRMIGEGLYADSLYQAFPTKTFPTHYTLATGRHPGTHGVVANSMWDPRRRASFSMRNRNAVNDGFWYQGGEPIWVTAERQGLIAATYFWPGSEAMIQRTRPTHYRAYDGRVPHAERVDQVLEWLALPESERPDFLTLYFSRVDSRGHRDGPAAPGVLAAAAEIDGQLGRLLAGLEAMDLIDEINIIVVSDHGMSAVSPDRVVVLDDYLDLSQVRVSDWGPAAQIWAERTTAEQIVAALDGAPHVRAWRREDIPERYRFGSHYRVPDVLVEADPGWLISSRTRRGQRSFPKGMHGWDPALAEMHGIFIARGPDFIAGSRAPAVAAVDLYALMAYLLGLEAASNEGRLDPFVPYLRTGRKPPYQRRQFDCTGERIEARIGPQHLALHHENRIYVLDRHGPHEFGRPGLALQMSAESAAVTIDGQALAGCRAVAAGR